MSRNSAPLPAVRGRLARYLGQLRYNLDAVGEQMREAVAQAVGRSVAEAVGEVVYDALVPHAPASPSLPHAARGSAAWSATSGQDWDERAWQRQDNAALWRESDPAAEDLPCSYEDRGPDELAPAAGGGRPRRWHEALAAGVQAAAWWLRRQRGPVCLAAALTVGAVTGLTVLVGPASNAAHLVASALGLAYLLDLVRSASGLLAANISSAWTRA